MEGFVDGGAMTMTIINNNNESRLDDIKRDLCSA
jgi:hypothetical protein